MLKHVEICWWFINNWSTESTRLNKSPLWDSKWNWTLLWVWSVEILKPCEYRSKFQLATAVEGCPFPTSAEWASTSGLFTLSTTQSVLLGQTGKPWFDTHTVTYHTMTLWRTLQCHLLNLSLWALVFIPRSSSTLDKTSLVQSTDSATSGTAASPRCWTSEGPNRRLKSTISNPDRFRGEMVWILFALPFTNACYH